MIKVEVKGFDQVTKDLKSIRNRVRDIPRLAYRKFVELTPEDTGNARRKTIQRGRFIEANYPYAERLDKGWSRQAPEGMVKPTQEYIQQLVDQINKGK